MFKRYLLIGGISALSIICKAQEHIDSVASKIKRTDIEVVYSHYLQDGNNSAITGGEGTEELTVFSPAVKIAHQSGAHTYSLYSGTDIITSASTDNINSILSSASRKDSRVYSNLLYANTDEAKELTVYTGGGFSFESDYLSLNGKFGFDKAYRESGSTIGLEFQIFHDDLRWGRLSKGFFNPVKLIYPSELRFKEWHEEYLRRTYNLRGSYTQLVNKRSAFGFFPEFTWQKGLLSTPFHRVYFEDATRRVENLPDTRAKLSLGLKYNIFASGSVVFRNSINPYWDSWGILGISFENETAFKVSPELVLSTYLRFYIQQGTDYFAPRRAHDVDAEFYTSDYDLSDMYSGSVGLAAKYKLPVSSGHGLKVEAVNLRYTFMKQEYGLRAHILSATLDLSQGKKH